MKKVLGLVVLLALAGATWADVTVYSPSGGIVGSYATIQAGVDDCQVV